MNDKIQRFGVVITPLSDIFFLVNGVMTTPKRWILSFIFTVLCLKKSLLIRIFKFYDEKDF